MFYSTLLLRIAFEQINKSGTIDKKEREREIEEGINETISCEYSGGFDQWDGVNAQMLLAQSGRCGTENKHENETEWK